MFKMASLQRTERLPDNVSGETLEPDFANMVTVVVFGLG